ncbi:hypothetical protein HK096_005820, partial [Nowakowskiella sp. JEL0078]
METANEVSNCIQFQFITTDILRNKCSWFWMNALNGTPPENIHGPVTILYHISIEIIELFELLVHEHEEMLHILDSLNSILVHHLKIMEGMVENFQKIEWRHNACEQLENA